MIAECKRRRKGFTTLYKAIEQDTSDLAFVRDDNQKPLVVLPWHTYELILKWLKLAEKFPPEPADSGDNEKEK